MSKTMYLIIIFFLLVALLFSIFFSSTEYVCYDGSIEERGADCPLPDLPTMRQTVAERNAENFGRAISSAYSLRYSGINVFREGGDWYQDAIFSQTRDGDDVYTVTLLIDGESGRVSCDRGCTFMDDDDDFNNIENGTANNTESTSSS